MSKLNGKRVLVVDDEESIRNVCKTVLEAKGYSVILCSTFSQAEAEISDLDTIIDMALLDLSLTPAQRPENVMNHFHDSRDLDDEENPRVYLEDGIRLANLLRRYKPKARACIMSGTAVPLNSDYKFIRKPFESRELLDVVEQR